MPDKPTLGDLKQAILQKINFQDYYLRNIPGCHDLHLDSPDGWSNRVLCEFHTDKSSPNFFVNLENGSFKCQACKAGGSIFDYWLLKNKLNKSDKSTFRKALIGLATEVGIDIRAFKASTKYGGKEHAMQRQGISTGNLPASSTEATKQAVDAASVLPKHNKAEQNDKTKKPIPHAIIEEMQKNLRRDHWLYLNQKRGLSKKTIEFWKIGFDPKSVSKDKETGEWKHGRYAIPIPNKDSEYRNVRLYSPVADADYKMLNYVFAKDTAEEQRYGSPVRLFGLHLLSTGKHQNIIICEGEWDMILLNQMLWENGYETWLAITGTHGANTFEAEWATHLIGKDVYFCYDCDQAGKLASLDHVNKYFLKTLAQYPCVKIVELPLDGSKENKDISDFFLKGERKCDDLIKLCLDTPTVIVGGMVGDEASQEPVVVDNFISAIKDRRYIDKRISTPITISGSTSKVYHAIRSFVIASCKLMDKSPEQCCSSMATERTLPYGHPLFIEACMERERSILQTLAKMSCQKDERCTVEAVTKVVMEEYFAHQVVERWRCVEDDNGHLQNAQELVQTSVYILQPEQNIAIEPQNYVATGFVRTHPKTSIATFFIETLVPMEEDWKKFSLETETRQILTIFQKEFNVGQILEELTNGVTRIYQMDEILITVLLSYLCPLWIQFNGSLQRGWINSAIIGDSGTGKSRSYQRLSDWIELGDLFSALSGTRTGLLYAIAKKSDEWHVKIGRYVQASRKIIAIDEAQRADRDELAKMAIAMDTGYLKVDQVASGGYHTFTRTIFLMNPKDVYGNAATVSDFTFGCDALRMCFDPMFIRRLDVAIFTTGTQKYDFYNQYVGTNTKEAKEKKEMRLTPRMLRLLIHWAWTRKADQVIWTEESTRMALEATTQLSQEFGDADQVPLAYPQDLREKIARLSVAYAILDRNFTDDLECVKVDVAHVQFVANFLERVYSMPACNLRHKSKADRSKKFLDDFDKIKSAFEEAIRLSRSSGNEMRRQGDYLLRFLSSLYSMHSFRKRELSEQLNVNATWVNKRIMIMQGYNLVDIAKHGGYKTTRKFNLFMQKWLQDPEIEKMFAEVQEKIGKQALEQADSLDPYEKGAFAGGGNNSYYSDDPFSE